MASLIVRGLDPDLVRRLKERAGAHGRSAEAEHRAILQEVLQPHQGGAELWARLRGSGESLTEQEIERIEAADLPAEVPDFGR